MRAAGQALSTHPIVATALGESAGQVLEGLDGAPPAFVLVAVTPPHLGTLEDIGDTGMKKRIPSAEAISPPPQLLDAEVRVGVEPVGRPGAKGPERLQPARRFLPRLVAARCMSPKTTSKMSMTSSLALARSPWA